MARKQERPRREEGEPMVQVRRSRGEGVHCRGEGALQGRSRWGARRRGGAQVGAPSQVYAAGHG